jgi:hypothetical protein
MADKPKIVRLLESFADFHPEKLAELFGHNIIEHKWDLSLETASAVLDYKGRDWERFGQDVGKILSKILIVDTLIESYSSIDGASWPGPWPSKATTTTTTLRIDFSSFQQGVADALGFDDVSSCMGGTSTGVENLWQAASQYVHGNWVSKAKAIVRIGEALEEITKALGPCSDIMTDAEKYEKLEKYLKDPRYYTAHNALTLALNLAEEHSQLTTFVSAWNKADFHAAGFELTNVVLDTLENPGIPSSNGTAAAQVAFGFSGGFASGVDFKCFDDAIVEIPALVGGVLDLMSVVKIVDGLESLFHGLEGLVPCVKACMADKPKIVRLLKSFADFHHPEKLAELFGHNIIEHKWDLSLETASAVLDYKGRDWERFGQDVGKILSKILIDDALIGLNSLII